VSRDDANPIHAHHILKVPLLALSIKYQQSNIHPDQLDLNQSRTLVTPRERGAISFKISSSSARELPVDAVVAISGGVA
jgi:hypothetical protein